MLKWNVDFEITASNVLWNKDLGIKMMTVLSLSMILKGLELDEKDIAMNFEDADG